MIEVSLRLGVTRELARAFERRGSQECFLICVA